MKSREATIELYRRYVNIGLARLFELMNCGIEVRSEGNNVIDDKGIHFLDCGGYCVFLLGHCHPRVVSAVRAQLGNHPISSRVLINSQLAEAAEAVIRIAPPHMHFVWFANSGAEVVEAAIKLSRANGKRRLVAMRGGYHGKSMGALSVTAKETYRTPFYPLLDNVEFIPYGDTVALDTALANSFGDAAVILEPIQYEGGVCIPPTGYLSACSAICQRHKALFIIDEISTGLGRVGYWWGSMREPCAPDIVLTGKALGGGIMPVSALIAREEIFAPFNSEPLLHTSTFAGNPLACVAVTAAIETIIDENLIQKSSRVGEKLLYEIRQIARQGGSETIQDVRGLGLLIGLEFREEHYGAYFMMEMMKHRVLVSHSLNAHQVVRLTPPATLLEPEIGQILEAVERSLKAVDGLFERSSQSIKHHAPR
jgi:putrescine aminotransferase